MAWRAHLYNPGPSPHLKTLNFPLHFKSHSQVPGIRTCTTLGVIFQPAADGVGKLGHQWGALSLPACPGSEVRSWTLAGPANPDICGGRRGSWSPFGGFGEVAGLPVTHQWPLWHSFLTAASCKAHSYSNCEQRTGGLHADRWRGKGSPLCLVPGHRLWLGSRHHIHKHMGPVGLCWLGDWQEG